MTPEWVAKTIIDFKQSNKYICVSISTLSFKSWWSVTYLNIFFERSLTKAALSDQKYSKDLNFVKYYYNSKSFLLNMLKCNLFLWCKTEFLASFLQRHMILQKSLECAVKRHLLLAMLKIIIYWNIIYLKWIFYKIINSLLSLSNNLMHHGEIKILFYLKYYLLYTILFI